ncbi:MAG: ACT domain-containing protein [Eubacterium sp.]|nr:ACT domain-containing protein [Eubacterium sp.]
MAITQLSAFLENVPGTLIDAVSAITEAGVNIRALSVADTKDFGILRVIVSDTEKTKAALSDKTIVRETDVIAVKMNDEAGALYKILKTLENADINVEYVYAFTGSVEGNAYVVFRVDDVEQAEELLNKNGIHTLNNEDISEYLK